MKSVGLSDEVYDSLLEKKHEIERKEGKVLSYNTIIKRMLEREKPRIGTI